MTGGWRLAVRNLGRNRRRNLSTGLAVALGYAAVVMLGGYAHFIDGLLRTGSVYLQGMGHVSIHRPGGLARAVAKPSGYSFTPDEQREIAAFLAADPRVELAGRYLRAGGLVGNGCKSASFLATGAELPVERRILGHAEVRRWTPDHGRPVDGLPLFDAPEEEGLPPVALAFGLATTIKKRAARGAVPAAVFGPRVEASVLRSRVILRGPTPRVQRRTACAVARQLGQRGHAADDRRRGGRRRSVA